MKETETESRPLSPLEFYYNRSLIDVQNHYRREWIKFFNISRSQFYARLKRPFIIDLVLWQIACDELILSDLIIQNFESNFDFSKVDIFSYPEKIKINKFSTII